MRWEQSVELYYPDIGWTGICADPEQIDYWMNNDVAGEIVCRQLGYSGGLPYVERYTSPSLVSASRIFVAIVYIELPPP